MTAPKDRERADEWLYALGPWNTACLADEFAAVRAEGAAEERARWLAVLPKCDDCGNASTYWSQEYGYFCCDAHLATHGERWTLVGYPAPWAELVRGES